MIPNDGCAVQELESDTVKTLGGTDNLFLRKDDVSASGTRNVTSELEYTTWNKILNPLDIDGPTRPANLRRITVYDRQSGRLCFLYIGIRKALGWPFALAARDWSRSSATSYPGSLRTAVTFESTQFECFSKERAPERPLPLCPF